MSLIVNDCIANLQMHEKLLDLRETISGRSRSMLSSLPNGLDRPLKIDEGLYLESYFDKQSLLGVATNHVLGVERYDYYNVRIALWEMEHHVLLVQENAVVQMMVQSEGDKLER